jgi:hypothetical protein
MRRAAAKGLELTAKKTSPPARVPISDDKTVLEERLAERFVEIAELTRLLANTQRENERLTAHIQWIHEIVPVLRRGGFRLKFLNRSDNAALLAKLKAMRLFDAGAYLAANPDVARAGVDPLQHYLSHGLSEGRSRG